MADINVDFVKASKGIVDALTDMMVDKQDNGERIRFVYNNAIDDAVNFIHEMGKCNPAHRLACMSLEREMREWLILREE